MKVLPINNGYFNFKSLNGQIYKSRVEKCLCEDITTSCDTLTYEGETYVIGIGRYYIGADKTENDINKLLILNMCARFTDKEDSFYLILSSPPNYYNNQKVLLPEFLRGRYTVKHNGVEKIIDISKVKVFPETFIAFANYQEKYKNKSLLIWDIGGYTTNIAKIDKSDFTANDYISIPHGSYHLDNDIKNYLNSEYLNDNFSLDDIQYMRDINHRILLEQAPKIDEIYNKHIETILNAISLEKWSVGLFEHLCIGGGSLILFDNIKQYVPQAELSKNPIFENQLALEKIAQKEARR